jgi:hypothetical protein
MIHPKSQILCEDRNVERERERMEAYVMIQSKMPMSVSIKETSMKGNPSRNPRGLQPSSHILLPLVVVVAAQVD